MNFWKDYKRALLCALWVLGGVASTSAYAPTEFRAPSQKLLRSDVLIEDRAFAVELALTASERQRGLMHRTVLEKESGMLFVFERPHILSFWMKDTSLALSIAYIDRAGKIIDILDLAPFSLTSVASSAQAQYALEVERGYFAAHNIRVGATISLSHCPTRVTLLNHSSQKVAGAVLRLCR